MPRWLTCVALFIVLATVVGCNREAEKDKNKDKDRPISADAPKNK